MYRCEDCGKEFYTPATYRVNHGDAREWGLRERYRGCPFCGGGYYVEESCAVCGELFAADELCAGICAVCGGMILRQLAALADQEFAAAERDYIREMIEI